MRTQQSLGVGHMASNIPARAGIWVLIWKDWLQNSRVFDLRNVVYWLGLFASGLGMLIAPDWGMRIWIFVVWGLLIGQVCSKRLCSDLNLWVIFRQLPFSGREILLVEIINPVIASTLLCWFTYGMCRIIGLQTRLPVAVLAPGIILCITMAAAFDILRHSNADALIAGHVAEMGSPGLIIGLILAGLPLVLVMWISSAIGGSIAIWSTSLLGLLLMLGIAYGIWQLTASQYTKM
jgi:hypothetical protein